MAPRTVQALGIANNPVAIQLGAEPDRCPICHHSILPVLRFVKCDVPTPVPFRVFATVVYQCPRTSCLNLFLASYYLDSPGGVDSSWLQRHAFSLGSLAPQKIAPVSFPADVVAISPTFEKVYNQAHSAEAYGLDEIAGPGG